MKKRRMALLLAAGMMLTTVSPFSLTGYAEEVIAEEAVELLTADETGAEAAAEVEMEGAEEAPEEIRADEDASEDAEAEIPAEEEPETAGDVEIPAGEDDFLESVVEVEEALAEENEYAAGGSDIESAEKIKNVPETYTADISIACSKAYFSFTPDETCGYKFYSISDLDTEVQLLDSESNIITSDDDSGDGQNFLICSELKKDELYYFVVSYYSDYETGSIPVRIEKSSFAVLKTGIEKTMQMGSSLTLDPSEYFRYYGSDTTTLTYQWSNGEIDISKEPTLVINNGGDYEVIVSDGTDSVSIDFHVKVDSGLTVISPEESSTYVTGTVGSSITLSVNAVTNDGTLSYHWYNDDNGDELGQSSQLAVQVTTARAYYKCVIDDGYNSVDRYFDVYPSVAGGTLSEGSGSEVTIADAGTYARLSFVPAETGLYRIHASSNGADTKGMLFDGNNVFLADNDEEYYEFNGQIYNDSPDFGIWYKLIAGETYYVTAGYYDADATGSFTVSADLMGEKCTHSFAEASRTAATCTTAGSVNYQCTVCTAKKTEVLPATGVHSYGPYTVTAAPTALAEGTQVRTCTVCGAQETASVAKLAPVVKLNVTSIPLKVKQSTSAVKVVEMAAGDSVVSWTSSNNKVATVTKTGKITGKKKGTATITVTLASGATAQVKVKVQKDAVKTKKVTVPSKKLTLSVKEKADLGASVTPITSLQKLTYTSSNTKVAAVTKKGVVTAKKKGTAKITIKSGGKKTVVNVTVK